MKSRLIFTLVFLTFFKFIAFAQTISGNVYDEKSTPIIFANIVLMASDSTFLNGTITDENGKFSIEKNPKAAFLSVSCLGYENRVLNVNDNNIERIILKTSDTELAEITVSAGLPKTRIKNGGMVTEVQNTLLSKVGSTERMLGKIPGVIKTKEGFEIFGKGTPEIYINGVKMRDKNELESINPENIKNVEVITNPGAQYDAEVKSVIRITTLKPVGEGFGFNIKSQYYQSQNTDLNEVININYRKNKLDLFANSRYALFNSFSKQWGITTNNSNYNWHTTNDVYAIAKHEYLPISGGFNYQINEKNSFGAQYTATFNPTYNSEGNNVLDVFKNEEFYDNVTVIGLKKDDSQRNLLNTYYNGQLAGFAINFNADFMNQNTEIDNNNFDFSKGYEDREINSKNVIKNNFFAQKLVMEHILFGGKISLGTETSITNRNDDYLSYAEKYVPTTKSQHKQKNIAGFFEYGYIIAKKIQLKTGLRYEHINFEYFSDGIKDSEASQSFDDIFPSASIATRIGNIQTMLSYSEKIRRPTYYELRNAVNYASRYHREYGDPKLKPSIIHSISLMSSWKFIQFVASFTNHINYIANWQTVEQTQPEVEKVIPININKLPILGIQLAAAPKFGIYNPNLKIMFQKQWLNSVSEHVEKECSKPTCNITFENTISFNKGWNFEANCNYHSKGNYQYVYLSRDYFNFEVYIEKSLLKDALSFEIGVTDIFYQIRNDVRLNTETGYLDIHKKSDSREFSLTVKYKFNSAKSKYKGTGAGNDEKQRM